MVDQYEIPIHTDRIITPWMGVERWINNHWLGQLLWKIIKFCGVSCFGTLKYCWCRLTQRSKYLHRVDVYTRQTLIKHENTLTFFKEFVINPRATGAIFSSSKALAQEMVSHVVLDDGIVIELGAGTGVVTETLLQSGIKPEKIIIVEYSHKFVQQLRTRFPTLRIIEGNAANLISLLGENPHKVNTIISSLPLRSLPGPITKSIFEEVKAILSVNGRYIQFTYSFRQSRYGALMQCEQISSKRIWLNLPPARVEVWRKY